MNTLRKQTKFIVPLVLTLSLLISIGVVYAKPPTAKTLRTTVHWTKAPLPDPTQNLNVSAFSPQYFKVNVGDSVELIISNRDYVASDEPHQASAHPIRLTAPDGTVIGEIHLHPDETDSIGFIADQEGVYKFSCANRYCEAHPYMSSYRGRNTNGFITVTA